MEAAAAEEGDAGTPNPVYSAPDAAPATPRTAFDPEVRDAERTALSRREQRSAKKAARKAGNPVTDAHRIAGAVEKAAAHSRKHVAASLAKTLPGKLAASGTHSTLRAPNKHQLRKAGISDEKARKILDPNNPDHSLATAVGVKQHLDGMRAAFGDDWEPSTAMLLHLAARGEDAEANKVTPEMIVTEEQTAAARHAAEHKNENGPDVDATGICHGEESLAMKLFKWSYADVDMPGELILDEHNAQARRKIDDTILLDPDCLFRQVWDLVQMVLLVYMALALPYSVGFSIDDPPLWGLAFWIGVVNDSYFTLDVYLSFVTCYYDEDGRLVADRRKIFARYFTGWFWLDLISVLPLAYLPYFFELVERADLSFVKVGNASRATGVTSTVDPEQVQLIKLLKLLRLVKLLRLARLKRLMAKYEAQFYVLFQRIKAFNLILVIATVAHWLACVWFFVGTVEGDDGLPKGWVVDFVKSRYSGFNGTAATLDDAPGDELYLVNYCKHIALLLAFTKLSQSSAAQTLQSAR